MPKKKKLIFLVFNAVYNFFAFFIKTPYYLYKFIRYFIRNIFSLGNIIYLKIKYKSRVNKKEKQNDSKKESAVYESLKVLKEEKGNFLDFEKEVFNSDSKIGIILGARGSGKSAFGIKFLENLYAKTKKNCYAIGFNKDDMPFWINVIQDIQEIKNNAFVLIDEGGVLFSSRDSMSKANKLLTDLILISRHKNLSILFISQNSANLDIDIIRQADYLIFKKSSLLQLDFERKKIKEIYKEISHGFEEFPEKPATYVYSDLFKGFVSCPLPSFWSVNISKSFSDK